MEKIQSGYQRSLFQKAANELGFAYKIREIVSTNKNGKKIIRKILQISNGDKSIFNLGATISGTDYIAMKMAVNKPFIHDYYQEIGLPVPEQKRVCGLSDLENFMRQHQKIVLKPSGSRAGKGVFGNIQDIQSAKEIMSVLKNDFSEIIAEEQIEGREYRALVYDGEIIAVAEYIPPAIKGDGKTSIIDLIKRLNKEKKNVGNPYLKMIPIKKPLLYSLEQEGLSLESVLQRGQSITLYKAAPISNGGTINDVTDSIHPKNASIAISAARAINLNIAGVDIITLDISKPMNETGGKIIEINGGPDLAVHYFVSNNSPINIAKKILRKALCKS
jgi:cyanophycin synthetase